MHGEISLPTLISNKYCLNFSRKIQKTHLWSKKPVLFFSHHYKNEDRAQRFMTKTCNLISFKNWIIFVNRKSITEKMNYHQTSNISDTLVGNTIVHHTDVVGALPVGAAPTTSSFSTKHQASIDWAKTTVRRDQKRPSLGIWCVL